MYYVSVIVPLYNMEKYIVKCLDSIVSQTLGQIELIIVNDGSTDNSKVIIQKYINEHLNKRIIYLEKKNTGLSDARNYGVKYASGKYISFIDADDYINLNLYSNLKPYMDDNIDLIKFKMITVDRNYNEISKISGPVFDKCSGINAFKKLYCQDKFLEVACIYLYKRDFFIRYNFKYATGLYHEDFGLTPIIINLSTTVVSLEEYSYYYFQNENSITKNNKYSHTLYKVNNLIIHYDNLLKMIKQYKICDESNKLLKEYYTNSIINQAKNLNNNDRKNYFKKIKKRKMLKNISNNNIKKIIKKILLHINFNLYLKLIDIKSNY